MIRSFAVSRAVKVPARQMPTFHVRLSLANDDCTPASDDRCRSYDRGLTVSYSVNIDGS
jgi:hypothetical protein